MNRQARALLLGKYKKPIKEDLRKLSNRYFGPNTKKADKQLLQQKIQVLQDLLIIIENTIDPPPQQEQTESK